MKKTLSKVFVVIASILLLISAWILTKIYTEFSALVIILKIVVFPIYFALSILMKVFNIPYFRNHNEYECFILFLGTGFLGRSLLSIPFPSTNGLLAVVDWMSVFASVLLLIACIINRVKDEDKNI